MIIREHAPTPAQLLSYSAAPGIGYLHCYYSKAVINDLNSSAYTERKLLGSVLKLSPRLASFQKYAAKQPTGLKTETLKRKGNSLGSCWCPHGVPCQALKALLRPLPLKVPLLPNSNRRRDQGFDPPEPFQVYRKAVALTE